MFLSKLTVGARLGLGFLLLIVVGLCVAAFGRYQLNHVNGQVTTLVEHHMARVEELYEIKENLNLVARAVRNIALMQDTVAMQAEEDRIKTARARNTLLLKEMNSNLSTEEERALLAKIQGIRGTYNQTIDRAIQLGMSNELEAAREVLIKENRPAQAQYFEVLGALIDIQKKAMNDTAQTVRDNSARGSALMLGMACVAAVMGGVMAWSLTYSITHQLGGEPDYAANVAREIAAGNLAVEVKVAPGDKDSLLAAMGAMRDGLAQVVARVRQGSDSVATASAQIATGNHDLSGRTEEQASALEQTAASMEQLGSTVAHNADNARQANQLAQCASTVAEQGGDVVAQVVTTMRDINTASKKIADIISVIDSIAFQTNILALNAAVEAARAGEQGRGFAVVASEVRSLAGRSAAAAKEIKTLITDSVERVEQGSMLVDKAGNTMHEVVTSIRRVTDIMSEIAAASIEQSSGVAQVGEAVTQMDQTTQQNAALVEEMAAAASSLQHQAQDLVQSVNVFKLG